jgi:Bacterial type II and III secretion system protein
VRLAAWIAALVLAGAAGAHALGAKQVRVSVEFRQSGKTEGTDIQGSGGVVITERRSGGVGRLGMDSQTTRSSHHSGIFTIVQDGGDSMLRVATRVPYEEAQFYRDLLTGGGYVARSVRFESVGTALKVHAEVLGEKQVRLRLTPTVSYFSADGSGAIELTDASTDLVVEDRVPVTIGGGTTQSEAIVQRMLGRRSSSAESETSIALTAAIQ